MYSVVYEGVYAATPLETMSIGHFTEDSVPCCMPCKVVRDKVNRSVIESEVDGPGDSHAVAGMAGIDYVLDKFCNCTAASYDGTARVGHDKYPSLNHGAPDEPCTPVVGDCIAASDTDGACTGAVTREDTR